MPSSFTKHRAFATDESGAVAMMFGLMFIVLTFAAGVAIDFSRINFVKSNYVAAVDAAALAAGRALLSGSSEDEAEAIALKFFEENINAGGGVHATYETPEIDVDTTTGGVTVSVTPVVDMTLTAVLGFESVPVPVSASTKFDSKDIELGMQLDLTGSMCSPCSKLAGLKNATRNLLDILLPDGGTPNKVRIGFAPYDTGVNVGTFADEVINAQGGKTCAYDRAGANANTDEAPVAGDKYKGKGDLPSARNCTSSKLIPLTSDKVVLETAVNGFSPGSSTAGQLGTQWAWNLISPKWATIWPNDSDPVDYSDTKTLKAVILMTDGEYNTFEGQCDGGGCDPYGIRGAKSNDDAKAKCTNMKAEGVVVYTVLLDNSPHPEAIETLTDCATSPDHYFWTENPDQLNEAFIAIAQQLNNLRLTN